MEVLEFLAGSWCNLFVMEEAFKPLIFILNKNKSKTMVCTNKSWAPRFHGQAPCDFSKSIELHSILVQS